MKLDRGLLNYTINEIKNSKGTPYCMSNEILADELYPYILEEFKDAQMIKYDKLQYIVVSVRAKNRLKIFLSEKKSNHEKALNELELAVNQLN